MCAEDIDLPSPVRPCLNIRRNQQDAPVLREPVPGEDRRRCDAPRCRRGAEVLFTPGRAEPVPAVQDKPALLEHRRADARRPAPADKPREIRDRKIPVVEPAEGGGRGERNLRPAPSLHAAGRWRAG